MTQLTLAFWALAVELDVVAADEEAGLDEFVVEGLLVGQVHIVDEAAVVTVKVIMLFGAVVVAVGTVGDFDFENVARFGQHFEVAIHRAQADVGNFLFDFMIHHIRRRVGRIALKGF